MKIEIIRKVEQKGGEFEVLKKNSIHSTIPVPELYKGIQFEGVWVPGKTKPILLHTDEYKILYAE